ncbi:hypothetical protein [Agathobaculum butyriciproducens]|uniref:hypothetical protein n=1 Tax=Agathobaculum butyriciproducens TaxID=1628085 RepID=UPI003AF0D2D4
MSKNQNKQAIFGGFRNQVGLQFFAGKNRMTEIEERLAAIRTEMDADGADLDALSTETDGLLEERKTLLGQAEQRLERGIPLRMAQDHCGQRADRD